MSQKIEFTVDELLKLFRYLEESNSLFHQPMNYRETKIIEKFAKDQYPVIKELYYDLLWNKLPKEVQDKITDE